MFAPHQKLTHQRSTGTQYTVVVASLVIAFVFGPIGVVLSGLSGYALLSMALVLGTMGLCVAWFGWKKYSMLTIPCITLPAPAGRVRPRA